MNAVLETESFRVWCARLDRAEQDWINKMKEQLAQSLDVGKPLRHDWLREKKLGSKRLYFIINRQTRKVLIAHFEHKKDQQRIITYIIKNKEAYLSCLR